MGTMHGLTVTECTRCPSLVTSRSRIVNGVGPADADLLFIGEAPGEQEDARGEPFVGRSGQVFDESLRENGLSRRDVRITNCVRCRPAGNRNPTKDELENCRGYLETEIPAVDPEVVVSLGKVPSQHLLGRTVAITAEAGGIDSVSIGDERWDVLLCVHPAATLYDRTQRTTFDRVLAKAAAMGGSGDQSTLGAF